MIRTPNTSIFEGIADELPEALHVADVPETDIPESARLRLQLRGRIRPLSAMSGAPKTNLLYSPNPINVEPTKVAAIALANKIARMAWAMMARGERYREPVALAA
jgi:hypothetical protein